MPRKNYRAISVPLDELDDWSKFTRTNDVRLPDPASTLDICRSLYKLAKRATTEIRQSDNVRSDNGIPVDHGTVLAARPTPETELVDATVTEHRIAVITAGERLLEKRIVLEKQRTETARWKAQASRSYLPGPSLWSGDGPPRTAPSFERFFKDCELCGHTHKNGTCPDDYALARKP